MANPLSVDVTKPVSLPQVEEQVLTYWDSIHAFERSVSERPTNKPFVFYDGPPFVTGSPHYGSILGSIAKDVVPRFWTMKGYRVERQWGWDCHGLPMEHMIEKELGLKNGKKGIEEYGIANFNQACRNAITRIDSTWEVIVRRIGRWVDFKHSYKTMDTSYMESVWWAFQQLSQKNLIYEDKKVILFCPRCSTPLSNFEIAMDNSYVDVTEPSTTYKFQVADRTFLLAWSTTPWTKIGTMALAVHPDLEYSLVEQGSERYILATARLEELKHDVPYTVIETMTGAQLAQHYNHFNPHFSWSPMMTNEPDGEHARDRAYRIVADPFVTADAGTGIVTLAIYGEDDYRVMKDAHIPLFAYVDQEGKLDSNVIDEDGRWIGRSIIDPELNKELDAWLESRGLVYQHTAHTHSIATCYRCGTRLFYAPLPAWFINVQQLKPQLLAANEEINWYPDHLKHGRFQKGIETAPDWNISRSRYWGTPIPLWRDESGQHSRVIGSIAELQQWAVDPAQAAHLSDIHREFVDDIAVWVDDARTIQGRRVPEVLDVWVDSSSMPFASRHYPFANKAEFEASYPAQFISEYINQTRAWFYTMHVLSVALFGAPSFKNAHNTGIILASDGSKMSKSKKNYSDPMVLVEREGADALRLYLMASPVTKAESLAFTDADVENMRKRVLNIWWNTFAFFQLYKPNYWQPTESSPLPEHSIDRWALAYMEHLRATVTQNMEQYDLTSASRSLIAAVGDISQWYLRQSRDRLRAGDTQAWQTFWQVLRLLALLFAPITPMISEATYQNLWPKHDSIHLELWPESEPAWRNEELLQQFELARTIVENGHAQRKLTNIPVRQPLRALVVRSSAEKLPQNILEVVEQELNIKSLEWETPNGDAPMYELDTTLTPDLEAEGEARKIIRELQRLRKEAGVGVNDSVHAQLPAWPAAWETSIREKTKAVTLTTGPWQVTLAE